MQHEQDKSLLLTAGCCLLFVVMAIFGWIKLQYGFNMIDEGMYMVDGWRLSAGDSLFPESAMNATMLYSVFNALVFKLHPEITLLGFRQLQYSLTLLSILVFGAAIYRWNRKLWPILLTLAVFAFTGLDTIGNNSNMSYYTYPHLFLILHIALFILALTCPKVWTRYSLFVGSGVALWGVGFSLLPLSASMISPVLVWLAAKQLKGADREFSFGEVLLVLSPGVILWGACIAVFNQAFFGAILDTYRYVEEGAGTQARINQPALSYIAATTVFWFILIAAGRLPVRRMLALVSVASVAMFGIMYSNLFGLIPPYWKGWLNNQMWASAFLITFMAAFPVYLIRCKRNNLLCDSDDYLLLAILVPAILFVLLFSNFSSIGIVTTLYVAIPAFMALALFVIRYLEKHSSTRQGVVAAAMTAILLPFFYQLAWSDWKFTYFDLAPDKLTNTIRGGFANGIKTNPVFADLVQWMETTADTFSTPQDFAIVMDQTPMGYMLIKRRPSLNHSWTGWAKSSSLRREAMQAMLKGNRQPKIVYRFLRMPVMYPISVRDGTYALSPIVFHYDDDPISAYVMAQMQRVNTFSVNGVPWVELYVRK